MINSIQGGNSGAITPPKHNRRFAKLDKNGDGGLDESELAGMAKRTGKDASKLLSELDANNDGKVDSGEMDAAMAKRRAASGRQPDAADQFTTALMNILKQLQDGDKGKDGSGDAFSKLDVDGDGQLSPSEFAAGIAHGNDGAGQNLQAAAKEFTTSLMNLFSQLQGSKADTGAAATQSLA
jgi:Ca2+-binding EF-hand superfamily protein